MYLYVEFANTYDAWQTHKWALQHPHAGNQRIKLTDEQIKLQPNECIEMEIQRYMRRYQYCAFKMNKEVESV